MHIIPRYAVQNNAFNDLSDIARGGMSVCSANRPLDAVILSCCHAAGVRVGPFCGELCEGQTSEGVRTDHAVFSLALLSTSWLTSVTGNSSVDLGSCLTSNLVICLNGLMLVFCQLFLLFSFGFCFTLLLVSQVCPRHLT